MCLLNSYGSFALHCRLSLLWNQQKPSCRLVYQFIGGTSSSLMVKMLGINENECSSYNGTILDIILYYVQPKTISVLWLLYGLLSCLWVYLYGTFTNHIKAMFYWVLIMNQVSLYRSTLWIHRFGMLYSLQ